MTTRVSGGTSVPLRSDPELVVEFARAIALGRTAHTRLYLVRNRTEVRRLPIRMWWFRDGLYVVRATEEYKDLLGCRVEKIGGMAIEAASEKVDGIKPGNSSWQRYMSTYLLTSPEILVGGRIVANAEKVSFELRRSGRAMKLTVHYSNGSHGHSKREYPERRPYFLDLDVDTLASDLPVEPTWADYAAGSDPALELIEAAAAAG